MALFSRRPKKPATPDEAPRVEPERRETQSQAEKAATDAATPGPIDTTAATGGTAAPAADESAPSVSISVSSFGGLGATPGTPASPPLMPTAAEPPATAGQPGDAATRRLPGIRAATQFAPKAAESIPGLRDNALLTWMHTRLFLGFVARLPWLALRGENPLLSLSPPRP